jgi:hypothetical protein
MVNSDQRAAVEQCLDSLGQIEFYLRSNISPSLPIEAACQCLSAARLSISQVISGPEILPIIPPVPSEARVYVNANEPGAS